MLLQLPYKTFSPRYGGFTLDIGDILPNIGGRFLKIMGEQEHNPQYRGLVAGLQISSLDLGDTASYLSLGSRDIEGQRSETLDFEVITECPGTFESRGFRILPDPSRSGLEVMDGGNERHTFIT